MVSSTSSCSQRLGRPLAAQTGGLRELLAGEDAAFVLATVLEGDDAGRDPVGRTRRRCPRLSGISGLWTGWRPSRRAGSSPAGRSVVRRSANGGLLRGPAATAPSDRLRRRRRRPAARRLRGGRRVSRHGNRSSPGLMEPAWFPQAARLVLARPERAVDLPPAARSLAVVKTHSLANDREWVRRLLAAGVPYVGVLGPRAPHGEHSQGDWDAGGRAGLTARGTRPRRRRTATGGALHRLRASGIYHRP